MNRVFLLFALFIALVNATNESEKLDTIVTFVDDVSKYNTENLIALEKVSSKDPKVRLHYTLGRRISGDRIAASGSQSYSYPSLQDVRLQLTYPTSGVGLVVTYVEIYVDQLSNIGNAYVVSGGVGQRRISIIIEAKQTNHFSYQAYFYGY